MSLKMPNDGVLSGVIYPTIYPTFIVFYVK